MVRTTVPRWRTAVLVGILLAPMLALASASPATAAADFPNFTGVEFKRFYYASMPLPQTRPITYRPAIYGHGAADARIQQLAERRGYRLQAVPTVGLGSYGGVTMAPEAGRAWLALADTARRRGTPLQGNSGYRSIDTQRDIFQRRLASAGHARIGRSYTMNEIASGQADGAIESVLAYHSIPGYSRHHTGVTIDMSHAGGSNGTFAGSAAYRWLSADNYAAAKAHGFIPNYPPNAGAQGPNPEPWEFSYVGVEKIRCAIEVIDLADPRAASICGLPPQVLVGNFDGGGIEDVMVYRPGRDPEGLFPGTSTRTQTSRPASQANGIYTALAGDFDGDDLDDILWYAPGHDADYIWFHRSDGSHRSVATTVNGDYRPVVGDFDRNGVDDVFWYAPGGAQDYIWYGRGGGTHTDVRATVNGRYDPFVGDLDGNGVDDVFWYAPGGGADYIWYQRADRTHHSSRVTVDGWYQPVTGDLDANGRDDVVWYAPRSVPDYIWYSRSSGFSSRRVEISGDYSVGSGDHDGDGFDDVVFLSRTGGTSYVWFSGPDGFRSLSRRYG